LVNYLYRILLYFGLLREILYNVSLLIAQETKTGVSSMAFLGIFVWVYPHNPLFLNMYFDLFSLMLFIV